LQLAKNRREGSLARKRRAGELGRELNGACLQGVQRQSHGGFQNDILISSSSFVQETKSFSSYSSYSFVLLILMMN
jgi:hypothetical protein